MKTTILIFSALSSTLAMGQTFQDTLKPKFQTQANLVHQIVYKGKQIRGQGQIIAILDSGVNYLQPQLKGKFAFNSKEISDDKKDNDLNGYIDDYRGWNFYNNNGIVMDDHGHGTHVAGTIVAEQYGIAPAANIIPVKVTITPEGEYSDQNLIKGIKYAADSGAKIINLSLRGVYSNMPVTVFAMKEAVKYAEQKNVLLVVAAGNDSLDITGLPVYPANIQSNNLITVCAVDDNNRLANFSNYSHSTVDFCAPGVEIASANKNYDPLLNAKVSPYKVMSGTSMATPIVSGIAALVWSAEPTLKASEVKNILVNSANKRRMKTPWLLGTSKTGGVINAYDAVKELIKKD